MFFFLEFQTDFIFLWDFKSILFFIEECVSFFNFFSSLFHSEIIKLVKIWTEFIYLFLAKPYRIEKETDIPHSSPALGKQSFGLDKLDFHLLVPGQVEIPWILVHFNVWVSEKNIESKIVTSSPECYSKINCMEWQRI